jgi:hypothetical protein
MRFVEAPVFVVVNEAPLVSLVQEHLLVVVAVKRRSRMTCALAFASMLACTGEESTRPSREDCEELRAHVAKLAAAEMGRGLEPAEVKKHEENLVEAAGDESLEECGKRSKKYVECALAATTTQALSACSTSK